MSTDTPITDAAHDAQDKISGSAVAMVDVMRETARKLERDLGKTVAALQKLVDVVDPIVPGQRPKLEPFFVEPVKQARATLAQVRG